jgi:hypothetical protein
MVATASKQTETASVKVDPETFVIAAIKALRDPSKGMGIHSVYSKFNVAFRSYFPELGKDGPIDTVNRMKVEGKVETSWARGGAMIYLPGESPVGRDVAEALDKILGK